MNYRAYFKSIEENNYKVEIITNPDDYNFSQLHLAGESPVTISYTTSERLFDPLRTSTCTVSLLTEDYPLDIYTGEAMGTRVDIYKDYAGGGGSLWNLVWTGYLQPNVYSQDYSDPISVLQLEASDIISTCQYFDYEILGEQKAMVTFEQIIKKILNKFPTIQGYFVSGGVKYQAAPEVQVGLNMGAFKISEHNFFSTEDEPWNLKEVLEEICRYFGLTCLQQEDTIYFIDYSTYMDTDNVSGLMCRKANNQYGWDHMTSINIGYNYTLSKDSYRETGGSMSLDDVFNKVQVRDNYYELKTMIPELLDEENLVPYTGNLKDSMYKLIRDKNPNNEIVQYDNVMYFFWKNKYWREIHYDYNWAQLQPVDDPEVEVPLNKVLNTDAMTQYRGANFITMSYQKVKDESYKTPTNFQKYLHISHLNGGSSGFSAENNHPQVETKDVPPVAFGKNTKLVLNMKMAYTFYQNKAYLDPYAKKEIKKVTGSGGYYYTYEGRKFLPQRGPEGEAYVRQYFYFRLNGKWFNGEGWQDTKTAFYVPMQNLAYSSYFNQETSVNGNIIPELWMSTNGYYIPLPEEGGMTEDFYFAIGLPNWLCHLDDVWNNYDQFHDKGLKYTWGTAHIFISDFSLIPDYQNSYFDNHGKAGKDKPDKEDNIYENIINEENVLEMDPIELKITTDNGKGFSYSNVVLLGSEPKMLDVLYHPKFDKGQKPEENIIQRYVSQYSTPTIREDITIGTNIGQFDVITDPFWNKKFFPMGSEIDLQMEKQTINLIEKKF